ncbi:peptidase family M1-domain-containing protein [Paraphysoderma sedebokerense]|nr:peptidase family M1-domain-containing protein [Paraphysoderma sedebokerense]
MCVLLLLVSPIRDLAYKAHIHVLQYTIRMKYSGKLRTQLNGYYLSKYDTASGERRYLAVTQFEATDARRAFPCFDEPEMKATFDITMYVQKTYHALSNMPVRQVVLSEDQSLKIFSFETTKRMSTYLVAFITSDFESITGHTERGVEVGVWTRPGETKMGEYALQAAIDIIEFYEKLFGVLYPLPKSDLFAVPDFAAGAMENWGLITYRDTALLYDPKVSSAANKQRVTTVVAHELGHQWFGNLVTMQWWDSLWLNEGFATFCEYLGTNATEPNFGMMEQFYIEDTLKAFRADASTHTHSIHVNVSDPAEIQSIFDDISYAKGGASLRMLQNYIEEKLPSVDGRSPFFVGLQKYLNKHQYGNARTVDLWTALDAPGLDVAKFMTTWTEQPGYPILKFQKLGRGHLAASQERFFSSPYVNSSQNSQTWQIPLTYQIYTNTTGFPSAVSPSSSIILVPASKAAINISLPDVPSNAVVVIKPNIKQKGFFRSQLPSDMLKTYGQWLEKHNGFLEPVDRAGLLEDTFALMMSGRLEDPVVALDMLKFLRYERDFVVWGTAFNRLSALDHLLNLQPGYGYFKNYVGGLVTRIIDSIGWKETNRDPETWHLRALLRADVLGWGVRVGHKRTVKEALHYFKDIKAGKKVSLPADVLGVIYDAAVKYGSDAEYDYILDQFLNSKFATDALRFLHALAMSPQPHLIRRSLDLALSDKVRSQDTVRFLNQIAGGSESGVLMTWTYLLDNWAKIMDDFGEGTTFSSINGLLQYLTSLFTSPSLIEEAEKKFVTGSDNFRIPPKADEAVKKGLEIANVSVWWLKNYGKEVQKWFRQESVLYSDESRMVKRMRRV